MILCNPPHGQKMEFAAYKLTHRTRETKDDEFSEILVGAGVTTHWDGMTLVFLHPEGGNVNIRGTGQPLNSTGAVYVGEGVERFWQYDIRRWGGGFLVSNHSEILDILESFSSRPGQLVARVRYLDYHYTFDFEHVGIVCPDDFFTLSSDPDSDSDSDSDPQGPYICEPCPDRECLAPDNAITLNDILDRLEQLGQGDWVDLSSVVEDLDKRVKSIERLTIGVRQKRKEGVTRLSLAKQAATTELTATENALNAFKQTLTTLLSSDYAGTVFAEMNDVLDNIMLALSFPAVMELDYTSTCDAERPERLIVQGPRLEVLSSGVPALASLAEATACKLSEFSPVATWPEWWGTRHGSATPQVVTIYAPKDKHGNWLEGRYPITVPHASQASPAKYFWKGPYRGRLILADNSDVIVCCRSSGDAKALMARLKSQIPGSLRRGSHESYGNTTSGIGVEKVWRKLSAYFPKGQQSREPEWVTYDE